MSKAKNAEELLQRLDALFGPQTAKKMLIHFQSLDATSDQEFDVRMSEILGLMGERLPNIDAKFRELSRGAAGRVEKLQTLLFILKTLKGEGQFS